MMIAEISKKPRLIQLEIEKIRKYSKENLLEAIQRI